MLRFIDSCRFMQSSLSSLVGNLAGTNTDYMICESCKVEMELVDIDVSYIAYFECRTCHSRRSKQLDRDVLKMKFPSVYRYCDGDEFFWLMLWKGVYPYEYMNSFERFDEAELP